MIRQAYLNRNPVVSFSINDTNQCFTGNAFDFTNTSQYVGLGTNYTWTFGDGNGSAMENPSHSYLSTIAPGIVKLVVATGQGCIDSTTMNISVSPNPVANFSINDSTQCLTGNQYTFTELGSISSGTYTTAFDFGDGNTGAGSPLNHVYTTANTVNTTLTLTSDSGCKHSLIIPVEIYPNPQVQFSVNDSAQCLVGNDFRVTDNTAGLAPGFARRWHVNSQQLPATGVNTQNSFANVGNHTFKLHITSDKGCEDSLIRTVSVDAHPDFTVTGPTKLCLNSNADLTANSLDLGLTYDWIENNNGPFTVNPYTVVGDAAGNRSISVTATNAAGCTSDSVYPGRVRVYPLPVPIIDTSIMLLADGVEISFIDNTNIPVTSRNWSFDPPAGGTAIREQFTIKDTTTYTASLTITDTNGCIGTTKEIYFFSIPNGFYLPTAFSPNGDSRNEMFMIPGYVNVKSYRMKVFNRWGEIVFQSDDPKIGWDGKVGGKSVQDGAYGYFVEIVDYDGKKVIRKGTVLLLR
ncbi:PKD domain-containing protein [Bacteroidia bacterium]|nr:PKD domain-containing protein [Bacteroidia bacterium]